MIKRISHYLILLLSFSLCHMLYSNHYPGEKEMRLNLAGCPAPELTTQLVATSDAAKDNAYALSMPLLTAAMLGKKTEYDALKDRMLTILGEGEKTPFNAWLWGRVLLAAQAMGDKTTEEQAAKAILDTINHGEAKGDEGADEFTAWAWSYLVAYYAVENRTFYNEYRPKMLATNKALVESTKPAGDKLWGLVMQAAALAEGGSEVDYQETLNQMKTVTGKDTVTEALNNISLKDYRAWAMSIVARAELRIHGPSELYGSLVAATNAAIAETDAAADSASEMTTMRATEIHMLSHVTLALADANKVECEAEVKARAAEATPAAHTASP